MRRTTGFQKRDITPPPPPPPLLPPSLSIFRLSVSPSPSARSRSSRSLCLLALSPANKKPLSPANKTLRRLRRRPLLTRISPGVSSPSDVRGGTLPPTPPHPLLPPLPSLPLDSTFSPPSPPRTPWDRFSFPLPAYWPRFPSPLDPTAPAPAASPFLALRPPPSLRWWGLNTGLERPLFKSQHSKRRGLRREPVLGRGGGSGGDDE